MAKSPTLPPREESGPHQRGLRAATVRPGNREVVHHSLVFSVSNAADFLQVSGGLGGFFCRICSGVGAGRVSGRHRDRPEGRELPGLQMHYTPNGKATTDRTGNGLISLPSRRSGELATTAAFDTEFSILPWRRDHEVVAETVVPQNSLLYEMSPHMHYRGARMRFEALLPRRDLGNAGQHPRLRICLANPVPIVGTQAHPGGHPYSHHRWF